MPSLFEPAYSFGGLEEASLDPADSGGKAEDFLQDIIDYLDKEESNMKLRSGERGLNDPFNLVHQNHSDEFTVAAIIATVFLTSRTLRKVQK